MKEFFEKNKIVIAIITGAFIVGGFIYLSNERAGGQSEEWSLYKQSAPYQPFYKFSDISLSKCQDLGQDWLHEPSNQGGEYSCCRKCKLPEGSNFLECGECYVYSSGGLRVHDKVYIPFAEIRNSD